MRCPKEIATAEPRRRRGNERVYLRDTGSSRSSDSVRRMKVARRADAMAKGVPSVELPDTSRFDGDHENAGPLPSGSSMGQCRRQ